ncbi:hypothetical protein [Alloacidobacterium sp.]|uniref:hypothetical protein n=1 Tax=Alloacidobacterium sp. TaxID=2951999 RepID=UPI002D4968B9|nr:hypothetical protein [Alloacidobacterium sp.]HYK35315.1 hypothetical protein [Alloacidobacterium sp.]
MLVLLLLLIVFLLGVFIGWLWFRRHPALPPPPPPTCPPPKVADQYTAPALALALSVQLMGTPADGSRVPSGPISGPVVWAEKGDEVLVHLESTQARLQNGCLLVSVDLETDQTGRQPLVMAFSVSNGTDDGGLIATTDELPRGNGLLAARWGETLQSAVWASLLSMSQQHAFERQKAPRGISIAGDKLNFHADTPLVASTAVQP